MLRNKLKFVYSNYETFGLKNKKIDCPLKIFLFKFYKKYIDSHKYNDN